jgi:hypothetical protein
MKCVKLRLVNFCAKVPNYDDFDDPYLNLDISRGGCGEGLRLDWGT